MARQADLKVIIVGGGLAGLVMGIMLEQAGIDYHILEQASRLRPLGTSISLHPVIMDVMDQLGLLQDMYRLSKPMRGITVMSANGRKMGRIDARSNKRRPDLHEFLLAKIPPQKLTTGKRVIDISESPSEVVVTCMDETTYVGHLVVGADGAYSAIRQLMYEKLKANGELPESDKRPLYFDKQCVVGMTCPLDPKKYPVLQDDSCEVKVLLGKDQHTSMWILPLTGNRMAWCVGGPDPHLQEEGGVGRGRDWYPETVVEICEDVRNFKCPYGGSVMDLIEATPKGLVSKVLLEEKMYRTWYHGRVVLIGDGASQAILDAACLANLLFNLPQASVENLTKIFQTYMDTRAETARIASDSSREFADLIYDQGFKADVARNIVLRFTPTWLLRMITGTINADRPSLSFLPPAKGKARSK
ncbi:hypothetical protein BGZ81_008107 [Podila clonocystis]|nr:hypothetical protein BGZ81_008107 [Podila clonocystis]